MRTLDAGLTELTLRPLGKPLTFKPGQFAFVFIEAKDGWHRHPFTIASGSGDEALRFTVKGLGDYTAGLTNLVEPGMPAVIGGPHGYFEHQRGRIDRSGSPPVLASRRSSAGCDEPTTAFRNRSISSTQPRAPAAGRRDHRYRSPAPAALGAPDRDEPGRTADPGKGSSRPSAVSRLSCRSSCAALPPCCGSSSAPFRRSGVRRANIHRECFDWR